MNGRVARAPGAASVAASAAVAAGCAGRGGGARGAAGDAVLEGAYRWVAVDGRPAPAEFPVGSGATLVAGTLELRDVAAARAGSGGRFGLRFTLRPPADTARATGEDGRFRVVGDSLHFTPDAREGRPPVRFRYGWAAGAALALTDAQGHVWTYVRR